VGGFNGFVPGHIAAHSPGWVGFYINGGEDRGAVYMMANPYNQGASLIVDDYAKTREFGGKVAYSIDFRNNGVETDFDIQGGDFR
jgi:hypothetical protein